MLSEIRSELMDHIVPFWEKLMDKENGGYYGYVGYDLKIDKKAPKGVILNSRILWFFSNVYLLTEDKSLLYNAEHAYDFLRDHCMDEEQGGVYWSLTHDGKPLDQTKHTYNQAFAIYGLASYYAASSDEEALKLAYKLVDIIEKKCSDDGGYLEAFDREFRPVSNEKLSENGVEAGRTMNTLLHIIEAYTELYRVTKDKKIAVRLKKMLDIFKEKIYNEEKGRQEVFFDKDYNSLIDLYSYGHDIETSWLIDRCLEVLDDKEYRKKIGPITDVLCKNVIKEAFDGRSLANECENGKVNTTRIWWVQAETLIAIINAIEKDFSNDEYKEYAKKEWDYIRTHQIDHRPGGEWYSEVSVTGVPDKTKEMAGMWKCPYHNGRMCIELIRRLERIGDIN